MGIQSTSQMYNVPMYLPSDYFEPSVVAKKYKQHGDQFFPLYMLLRSMMREEGISRDSWTAYEDQEIHQTFHEGVGFVDPGVNTAATLTLTAANGDVDANGNCYLREGDIVEFLNKNNGYIVRGTRVQVSPTTVTFTVKPFPGNTIGAVVINQEIPIVSGAVANGTGPVAAAARNVYQKKFYLQTLDEHISIEGGVLADQVWAKTTEDGKTIIGVYSEALDDLQYRVDLKVDGALWTGQENPDGSVAQLTETGGAGYANPIYTTGGIIPAAGLYGKTYPTTGTWAMTNFDDLTTYLVQQRVQSDYMLFMVGNSLSNHINNVMANANLYTAVNYTQIAESLFGGGAAGKDLSMSINFTSFRHNSGYEFLFRRLDNFSNPTTFGVAGYGYDEYGMVMPLNKVKDPRTGVSQNNLEFKYKKLGKYSRRFKVWTISGAGEDDTLATAMTANDWSDTYARGSFGLQIMKANHFILLTR